MQQFFDSLRTNLESLEQLPQEEREALLGQQMPSASGTPLALSSYPCSEQQAGLLAGDWATGLLAGDRATGLLSGDLATGWRPGDWLATELLAGDRASTLRRVEGFL
jgi:hypothetical protein